MNCKKGISPVVAIALLLVVSVVAVVGYQQWYQGYQSILTSDVEQRSTASGSVNVEFISSDGIIYITNTGTENVSMSTIKIGDTDCNINQELEPGVNDISISSCLNNTGTNEIMLVTDSGIIEESLFVEEIVNVNQNLNQYSSDSFVSVWNTSKTGSASDTLVLPLEATGDYNFTVDWGDGSQEDIVGVGGLPINHTYASSGLYEVIITGKIKGFRFNNGGDKSKIIDIKNWGSLNLGNNGFYFRGCNNLDISATDALNLTGTTSLIYMFFQASSLTNPNFNSWDVSNVENMRYLFAQASSLTNPNFNSWDVSKVTNMERLFEATSNLGNIDISEWDVSNVTQMHYMFSSSGFNGNISNWNTKNVYRMDYMFLNAINFNQNISGWNTSNASYMSQMFRGATSFDQDLNNWDLSSLTTGTLYGMFWDATSFNGNISNWNTSLVFNMGSMFFGATSFNQDLRNWCVSLIGSEPSNFALSSPLDSNGMKPIWGTCP